MKKIIVAILVVLVLAMTGCSCVPENSLSFTNSWNASNTLTEGITETSIYTVTYKNDYQFGNYSFKKGDDVGDFFKFENGLYTQTIKVISKSSAPSELSGNDILSDLESVLIHMHTEFSITAKYTYDEKTDEVHNDKIVTDVYFGSDKASFTPIYTKSDVDYSIVSRGEKVSVERIKAQYETTFTKTSYTIKTKIGDAEPSEQKIDNGYKKYIDNTQLLFAMRNITITRTKEQAGTHQLPTVSPVYGNPQNIGISYFDDSNEIVTVNDTEYTIPCKALAFSLSNTQESGRTQLIFTQNGTVENLLGGANRALIVKYVEPLMTYGAFDSMGALVYELKTVTVA